MDVSENPSGNINRREFLVMAATAAVAVGCQASASAATAAEHQVDIGPASLYTKDGVYSNFRDHGFFVARHDGKLFAYSSMCTHRSCKLTAKPDHTFFCPCHGSIFDPGGKVTRGPAKKDLPTFAISTNSAGHLVVKVRPV